MDEWIKKIHTHTHDHTMEYYLAIEKNKIFPLTISLDLEGTMLSEISHTEKDKCCMISLVCRI